MLACGVVSVGETNAQVGNLFRAGYDTSAVAELFDHVAVGFVFPDGSATQGLLGGRVRWKDLSVVTPQGHTEQGVLFFDREAVWQNHHRVSFTVTYGKKSYQANMPLPYVTALSFRLFTDSLKRDNPFDLNVEGIFSSGKIYPLDTSMVRFSKSGGGTLSGGILTVAAGDTATHRIGVTATLLFDAAIRDSVSVPVKILPDTATLPTERTLLRRWQEEGKKGRR